VPAGGVVPAAGTVGSAFGSSSTVAPHSLGYGIEGMRDRLAAVGGSRTQLAIWAYQHGLNP